jgi:PAS domain S-box-containing protein
MRSLARYGGAVILVLAAALIQSSLPALFSDRPFFLFFAATFAAAVFLGFRPALLAIALASAEVLYVSGTSGMTAVQTLLFAVFGLALAFAVAARQGAEQRHAAAERERGRLGAEIERERQRLLSIVSNVPGIVWEAWGDPGLMSQRMNFVSEHVTRMLGYSVEEWLAQPNFWLTIVHPEDREMAAKTAHEHFLAGGSGTNTFRWMTKDGRELWVESHSTIVAGDDGKPIGMRGVTFDIHARKRAEDSLRLLTETSEILSSSLDYETIIPEAARRVVSHLGDWCAVSFIDESGFSRRVAVAHRDPAKDGLAQKMLTDFPPRRNLPQQVVDSINLRRPTILNAIDESFIATATSSPEHAALVRELGFGSMLVAPMVARDRFIGAISFISARHGRYDAADAELAELVARRCAIAIDNAQLYHAAVEASNAKDEFLATVSHELRTPMTATLGWVRMLSLGHFDPETHKTALEAIERSTRAQAKLIEDILDVSSIILGKFRLDRAPVDLRGVVDAAIDTLRPASDAKNITIDVHTARWSGIVQGDADRLQQVMWNLVSNAIKFGQRNGHIDVVVERADDHARISVRDDGPGIDPAFLPHVFDRFRQADGGATRAHGGLGLGLAIVRHLVELHGGTVRAVSDGPGTGAAFIVELPATLGTAREGTQDGATLPNLAKRQILVVDDERSTLDLFSAVLRRCGAEVTTAESVDEAMVALNRRRHDLVVTDIAMPGTDGAALLQLVRGRDDMNAYLPVIALTALTDVPRGNFTRLLHKPIDPIELATEVANVIAGIA